MPRYPVKDQTAICGVGTTEKFGAFPDKTLLQMAGEAFREALADCGLNKEDIDGIVVMGFGSDRFDFDRVAPALGIKPRFCGQTWLHGRFMGPSIQWAAMAACTGMADCVACFWATDGRSHPIVWGGASDTEGTRPGGGPHIEFPEYGMTSPGAGFAMLMKRYLLKYGYTSRDLAALSVAQRKWAQLNPLALMHKPLTVEDYLAARYVVEPLRLYDYCPTADGAICIIITTAERARHLKKPPVYISGMSGLGIGRLDHSDMLGYSRPYSDRRLAETVFGMAGVTHKDIDALYAYDSFSPMPLFSIEEYGFCPPGEVLRFIQGGRLEPGGELPFNTNGGQLSESFQIGWGHHVELVRQLRGEAGARQVKNAGLAMYIGLDSATIFRR